MLRDKAALSYHGKPQLQWTWELLDQLCQRTFISVRADQANDPVRAELPQIVDQLEGRGPIAGIAAAQAAHPKVAWLVLACDLPLPEPRNARLPARESRPDRDSRRHFAAATTACPSRCARSTSRRAAPPSARTFTRGKQCPRKFLIHSDVKLLDQLDRRWLDNANTPDEYRAAAGTSPGERGHRQANRCTCSTTRCCASTPGATKKSW